jgi:hypothetical protein
VSGKNYIETRSKSNISDRVSSEAVKERLLKPDLIIALTSFLGISPIRKKISELWTTEEARISPN